MNADVMETTAVFVPAFSAEHIGYDRYYLNVLSIIVNTLSSFSFNLLNGFESICVAMSRANQYALSKEHRFAYVFLDLRNYTEAGRTS